MSQAALNIDAIATCLAVAARLYGQPATPEALTAGLPLEDGRLTPALAARAAERAGLAARVVRIALKDIDSKALPIILLTTDRDACVLASRNGENVDVIRPELADATRTIPLDDLAKDYSGYAILVGRLQRFSAGTESERLVTKHHWFWGTLRAELPTYTEVAVATVLINVFALASPLFFMNVYDRVVPNRAMETLWILALGLTLVLVFDLMLKILRGYFIDVAGKRADQALSAALFARVMDLKLDQPRQAVGSLANNLREFESLREFFTSATLASLVDLPFVLLFVAVIVWIGGGWMVLPVLVAIPLVLGVGLALQPKLRDHIRRSFAATEAKYSTAIETLAAIEHVKHLNAASQIQRKWESLVDYVAKESLSSRMISSFAINFTGWVQGVVSIAVLIIGAYLAAEGQLTLGALIACSIITGRAVAPLTQLAGLLTRYHTATSALSALNKIMEAPVEREPGRTFVSRPRLTGRIEFRGVTFRYPGQQIEALRELSFAIAPGDRVGVVGRMGSGKSTLAKLLIALYQPQAGSVLVDSIDSRQIDPADLRRNIGYMPQNVVLFNGTLRHNVTMGAVHIDDAAMLRAVQLVGLDDHIQRHPQGFDMPVGERGEALSGGQRQAVALARALLEDPPVLLLDEPTASMDIGSEEQFKARLAPVLPGRTLIVVTHRESMLTLVDKLIVMDNGRAVAAGPKAEVLQALSQGRVRKAG
ncbi:MAG: transporter, transrane region:ABC transporter:Peptidase bacteriocin processing [Betaproteobacteria bacterium]|nr:transporter, transrane region:ABC transporter:Peptidase bacteriocin processing [Betaproteobacteria bacterium]